jgi:iron complex transport system substrate-binding protein
MMHRSEQMREKEGVGSTPPLVLPCGRRRSINKICAMTVTFFLLEISAASLPPRMVTDQTGRRVNIPENPQRLISLAPSITETLYALGLGDRIVGDTTYCDYPPEARLKPHVGALLNPSMEAIVALKPDLVLGIAEANRRETAEQLERLSIPIYGLTAHSVEETLHSIEDLAQVLDRGDQGKSLVESLRRRVDAVKRSAAGQPKPKVLFVVWYRPLITAGPHTFIADAIRVAGGVSIADDLAGEWPRMSLEDALHRDPDIILFSQSESFSPALDEFQQLPGWRDFRAVKDHRLYFISDTINRPSPRLIDALEEVARTLHPTPHDHSAAPSHSESPQ